MPEVRRNEILRLIEGGLEDISVSRAGQAWGIPLPDDPSSVVYVWFDALINYIIGRRLRHRRELTAKWWPADLHVIGKDITRFHAVIWPAMLMSAGLPVPRQVFGHGWIHYRGEKMSKSLGTTVDPIDAAERFGTEPLRLYLAKEVAFGSDGDFTWDRFEDRYNVDLANNLGNLVSRVAAMAEKYRGGRLLPAGGPGRLADVAHRSVDDYRRDMDAFALEGGAAAAFRIVDAANEYIAETEPWALAREAANADRLSQVLFDVAEAVRIAGMLLQPIMPRSAAEILRRVGAGAAVVRLDDAGWRNEGERRVVKGEALWPRADKAGLTADMAGRKAGSINRSRNRGRDKESRCGPSVPGPAGAAAPPAASAPAASAPAAAVRRRPARRRVRREDHDRRLHEVELRSAKVLTAEGAESRSWSS